MSNIVTGLAMVVALGAGDGSTHGWESVGQPLASASAWAPTSSPAAAGGAGQASVGSDGSLMSRVFGGGGNSSRMSSAAASAPPDWVRAPNGEIGRPALPSEPPSIIDRILGGGSGGGAPSGGSGGGGGGSC